MSVKHPIISVTGSSGAGTSTVRHTFEQIFRREKVKAAFIEGDAFHRYDRAGMKEAMAEAARRGDHNFSHFGPEANLLDELEGVFRRYADSGEINSHVAHPRAKIEEVAAAFPGARQDRLDGLTVEFDDWWCNVRPSNTEPLLRLNVEASSEGLLAAKTEELLGIIRS